MGRIINNVNLGYRPIISRGDLREARSARTSSNDARPRTVHGLQPCRYHARAASSGAHESSACVVQPLLAAPRRSLTYSEWLSVGRSGARQNRTQRPSPFPDTAVTSELKAQPTLPSTPRIALRSSCSNRLAPRGRPSDPSPGSARLHRQRFLGSSTSRIGDRNDRRQFRLEMLWLCEVRVRCPLSLSTYHIRCD